MFCILVDGCFLWRVQPAEIGAFGYGFWTCVFEHVANTTIGVLSRYAGNPMFRASGCV